jgi:hypothetical protein
MEAKNLGCREGSCKNSIHMTISQSLNAIYPLAAPSTRPFPRRTNSRKAGTNYRAVIPAKAGIQTCPWQGTGGDRYHAGLQPWVPRLRGCNPAGACTGGADASPFGANGDGAPAVIPAQAKRRPGSMVPQASEFTYCFVDPFRSEATSV